MLISNIPVYARMAVNRECLKIAWKIHSLFSQNRKYKLTNLVRCGLHVIESEKIKVHDGKFVINSFIPPINSKAFESILMAVPGRGSQFFEDHITGKRKAPISVYLSATDRCMYNCWHCSAAGRNSAGEIGTSAMAGLVKQLQDMGAGIIGFTGGEPLLRDDLEEIIRSIDERSVSFVFSTGFGLDYERAVKLKEAGLLGIAISVDSTDEKVHDERRGYKGAFKVALDAIKAAGRAGLYTMSQTVCTRELLQEGKLFDLAGMMSELGVDEMRIIEPMPCGKLGSDEKAQLDEEEARKLIEFHVECNKNTKLPKASVFSYFESIEQFGCGAGVQHSYIDAQGNLYPCDFVPVSFGNVFERPATQLWEEMHAQIGQPGGRCFSKAKLSSVLKDYKGSYPVSVNCLAENCCKCESQDLPWFYRILAGEKR